MARLRSAAAPAQAAEVVSSNIVGYNKITLTPGYNMLGGMFVQVGGDAKTIDTVFTDNTIFVAGESADEADTIMFWNGNGYTDFIYSSDAADDNAEANWASGEDTFTPADLDIARTDGFWFYKRGSETTAVLAGEVANDDKTVEVVAGYNMIANPFAAALPLKNLVASTSFVAGESADEADTIMVWNGSGYNDYIYSSDAADDNADANWASGEDTFTPVDFSIDPGHAFWFYRRGSKMTLTISSPIQL